jgi:hypothetical protein
MFMAMKKPAGKKSDPPTRGQKADSKRKINQAARIIANNNELKKMNPGVGAMARRQTPSSLKSAATYKGK